MEAAGWVIFLGSVFVGSYVQSVTGFAMGMIVIAVVGASGVISLPVLTAAASLITMVNVAFALVGHTHAIDRRIFLWLGAGQIPAIGLGVAILSTPKGILTGQRAKKEKVGGEILCHVW